jgi:cell division protein ZapA
MSVHEDVVPVTIRILDKEYQIACTDEERNSLLDSARYLDEKMKEIRNSGKVIGSERVAVMAALNIAHDLLQSRFNAANSTSVDTTKIKSLKDKVETALTRCKQLEL